jgi:hypothetical protein
MFPAGPLDYIDVQAVLSGLDDGVSLASAWLDYHAELGVVDHELGEAHGELWQANAQNTAANPDPDLEAAELAVHGPSDAGQTALQDAEESAEETEADVGGVFDGAPGEMFQPVPAPFVPPADSGFGPPSGGDDGNGNIWWE